MRRNYRDASHNVFAYRVLHGGLLERQSDDGEPSGTAGKPILDIISGAGLLNVCINVARYFGGVLLGTGGLVRAYQAASRETISTAQICQFRRLVPSRLVIPYHCYDKFLHISRNHGYTIQDSAFAEDVTLDIICEEAAATGLQNHISALSLNARLSFGEAYFGVITQ